jgi:hypothetical protein
VNILQSKDILSDIIHKDKKEVAFKLTLDVAKVEGRIWQNCDKAVDDMITGRMEGVLLALRVDRFMFSLVKH